MIGAGTDVTVPLPLLLSFCLVAPALPAAAQDDGHAYAGALFGVSTLSADARDDVAPRVARASLYKPENGPSVNAAVGVHVHRFVSIQANYIWNRNRVSLLSSIVSPDGGGFHEQERSTMQSALIADMLVYVRALDSRVRPYFSIGVGAVRFGSDQPRYTAESGVRRATGDIGATRAGLRVAVGIDLAVGGGWSVRYSFSDTVSGNPISEQLTPPGQRGLANFQSLFGLVRRL
jgi:opacity protein-like surface antigen